MLKKIILPFILILFSNFNIAALPNNIEHETLKNGLQVYYIPTTTPSVTLVVAYSVGSINEESGKEGIAHLLEHLMFLGTYGLSKNEYSNRLKNIGASYNAYTTYDATVYYTTLPNNYLNELLYIEADRMQFLRFNSNDIANEINIVIEENNAHNNQQYSTFFDLIKQISFTTNNYGRSIIGYSDTFSLISLADVKEFYTNWYKPSNATLVIIGGFDVASTKKQVKKNFARISNIQGHSSVTRVFQPQLTANININYTNAAIKQAMIVKSFLAPSYMSDTSNNKIESSSLFLLASILNLPTSTLYKNLVSNNKLANDISIYYNFQQKGTTNFMVVAKPNLGISYSTLVTQLNTTLDLYKNNIITEKELKRVKKLLLADLEYSKENQENFAIQLAHWSAIGLNLSNIFQFYSNLDNITVKDVNNSLLKLINQKFILATANAD